MSEFKHIPVLLKEVIEGLGIKADGIYVDCTIGGGGHSSKIVERLSEKGHLYGFDRDNEAVKVCKERFKNNKNVTIIHANYKDAPKFLQEMGVKSIDGFLIDLGVSSYQIDTAERGLALSSSPLAMTGFLFISLIDFLCPHMQTGILGGHRQSVASSLNTFLTMRSSRL